MIVEYSSNNSGGDWWLSDDDWRNLEEAGWAVEWVKDDEANGRRSFSRADETGRWLGALATDATIEAESVEEAIEKWRAVVGQDPDVEGCPCCGQPHSFWGRVSNAE